MQIYGLSQVHGAQQVSAPHAARPTEASRPMGELHGADEVAISDTGELLAQIRDLPDMRADRVAELRSAIASGVYESSEKLDLAVERLLDEIA